jgi:hypothetical protein
LPGLCGRGQRPPTFERSTSASRRRAKSCHGCSFAWWRTDAEAPCATADHVPHQGVQDCLSQGWLSGTHPARPAPCGRTLAGVARDHTTLATRVPGYSDLEISNRLFAMQFGGGGDVHLTRDVSVRMAGDVRINGPQHSIDWHLPEWRLQAGMGYAFQR